MLFQMAASPLGINAPSPPWIGYFSAIFASGASPFTMYLIDSHVHLYLTDFDSDRTAVVKRAEAVGVKRFYLPAIGSHYTEAMLRLEAEFPDRCFAMMGLHPTQVKADTVDEELKHVRDWLDRRPFKAVGEIGIDLHGDRSALGIQVDAFRTQLKWAKRLDLPVVIHCRRAFDEVFSVLDREADGDLSGVFHCFTGDKIQAERAIGYAMKLGIGGVLTFKNSGLDKTLAGIDIEHLVLETDAPYLAPTPHRGKRNEPAYLKYVAKRLSEMYALPQAEIAKRSTANALGVFES